MNSVNSAKIRTELCCLPPIQPFPPHLSNFSHTEESSRARGHDGSDAAPFRHSDGDPDDASSSQWETQIWSYQQEETRMMEVACDQFQWLVARLTAVWEENDNAGGSNRSDGSVQTLLTKLSDAKRWKHAPWTIFDLQHLSSNNLEDSPLKGLLSLFASSLKDRLDSYSDHDKQMHNFWNAMLEDSRSGFNLNSSNMWKDDVLVMPFRSAASQIFQLYDQGTEFAVDRKSIHNYLSYSAARTLEHLEHFTLPHLKNKCLSQEQYCQHQKQRQKKLEKLNNDAFEQWDEFCMNVLGVESDSLPLFPEVKCGVNELGVLIDGYAKEVGRKVVDSMRSELERLSEHFLQLLAIGDVDVQVDSRNGSMKCYGKDISYAITYYQQFTKFLLSISGDAGKDTEKCDNLSMLHHYVTSSTNGQGSLSDPSLLSQFTSSPAIRTNLFSDVQHLEAFLSSRQIELSSRSLSAHTGRDIIDATELEWRNYCIVHQATFLSLEEISLEDVTRFYNATRSVNIQIIGHGTQAKRLRFLADTVGLPARNVDSWSPALQPTCRKAASLAHRMALCQHHWEVSSKVVESCFVALGLAKDEILETEHRIKWIRQGLIESGCFTSRQPSFGH